LKRLWNNSKKPHGISPIVWMMFGGIIALTLAPTLKKTVQETEIANNSVKKVITASNIVLGNVKKNLKTFVANAEIKHNFNQAKAMGNKVRVRKRNMAVGAGKNI